MWIGDWFLEEDRLLGHAVGELDIGEELRCQDEEAEDYFDGRVHCCDFVCVGALLSFEIKKRQRDNYNLRVCEKFLFNITYIQMKSLV